MIVTLTPNPSVDRTLAVPALDRGEVNRSSSRHVDPGGKGINVARVLLANGHDAVAVVPVGGAEGAQLARLLESRGVAHHAVPIAPPVRSNLAVVEPDGTTTKFNEAGPSLSADEMDALLAATAARVEDAAWLASCGSLFAGAPADFHAQVVEVARRAGARVAVDASGTSLLRAVEAGPDVVKPNHEELAEAVGRPLADLGEEEAQLDPALGQLDVLVRRLDRVVVVAVTEGRADKGEAAVGVETTSGLQTRPHIYE